MKFKNAYSESEDMGLKCEDPSLAIQSQKDESDINTIVKRFGLTGTMPQGVRPPTYGDFSGVIDFRTAMDAVNAAERSFMQLPAEVRKRFGNDPASFVDFCSDKENLDDMRKMGLAIPKVEPIIEPPVRVEVVSAPPAGG